jgi:hypothetical protein
MLFFICFCIILLFILNLSTLFLNVSAYGHSFKVSVNVYHRGFGSSKVCVSSAVQDLGCKTYQLDNEASPITSRWQFKSGAVQVGDTFTACVTNVQISATKCVTGENIPHGGREVVSLDFPVSNSGTKTFKVQDGISAFKPETTLRPLHQKIIPAEITKIIPAEITKIIPAEITKIIPAEITDNFPSGLATFYRLFPIFIIITVIVVGWLRSRKLTNVKAKQNITIKGLSRTPNPINPHSIGTIQPSVSPPSPTPNPINLPPSIGTIQPSVSPPSPTPNLINLPPSIGTIQPSVSPPSPTPNPINLPPSIGTIQPSVSPRPVIQQPLTDWPTPLDYQEAIQYPTNCFTDPELKFARFKKDRYGFPLGISGNFASVYQATTRQGFHKAVRCFQRPTIDLADRYEQISVYSSSLSINRPSSLVGFKYIENGIRVKQRKFYPIVKMDWVDGDPLNVFIRNHIRDKKILQELINKFVVVAKQLRSAHIAHGDLQHGNIIVTPRFEIKLIDYDGMYIPAFKGKRSMELGHPNYQHILRDSSQFDENLDNFSELIIYLSLRATMIDTSLFEKYHNLDNLIFQQADFLHPTTSGLINRLRNSNDKATKYCTNLLTSTIHRGPNNFPSLESILKFL